MTAGEAIAVEEIYCLALHRDGKAERKTRRLCTILLGEARAARVAADWDAAHNYAARTAKRP